MAAIAQRTRTFARPLVVASLLFAAQVGCVTERTSSRGTSFDRDGQRPALSPVARPIAGDTLNTNVTVAITPLGSVEYDGQVLPLVSPDGNLIAVQMGEPPSWQTLLAKSGGEVPLATRIVVFDASTPRQLRDIAYPEPLPLGLMLGRGADARGFLVEAPRPDGSRSLGLVNWASGRLTWLVDDGYLNSGAVLTQDGDLLYARRPITAPDAELVLKTRSGSESTINLGGSSFLHALATQERDAVYALLRSPMGIEILAISLTTSDPPSLGSIRARATLTSFADDGIAYQAAAPIAPPLPRRAEDGLAPAGLALFHPSLGRVAIFDVRSGGFLPLAPRSVAAARTLHGPRHGLFATTPEGLVFCPEPSRTGPGQMPRERPFATVLADPYVARPTLNPERPMILFGPDRSGRRLQLFILNFPPEQP